MNYIDTIADAILRETGGPGLFDIALCDRILYRMYAVLALAKGTRVEDKDVHDAWAAWESGIIPDHRSLIPFRDLDSAVRLLDRRFTNAIRTVALRIAEEGVPA